MSIMKKIIRKGDTTTHGGKVLEGSDTFPVMGEAAACMGHMVYCPKCNGNYPIIEGSGNMPIDDKFIAVEGMKTACGAELIASQDVFIIEHTMGEFLNLSTIDTQAESILVASLGDAPSPPTTPIPKKEKEKKVSWRIINFEKVHIMVNDNGYLTGEHAGMMIGESGKPESLIYDPGGHYDPCRGKKDCQTTEVIGSGRTVHGKDTDFKHYIKCQIEDDGPDVHVFVFDVDEVNVVKIKERIFTNGGSMGGLCAQAVSNAITNIEPFGEVSAIRPKELKKIMQNLKKKGK